MKCSLDGSNARIFAKAVQSLSKFGTDLFIEADQQGLQLRSINATGSAVGTFRFNKSFFESYEVQQGNENYCKIAMKACLTNFRNLKKVEQCKMQILHEQSKFQIQFVCLLETVKNALISIVDEENITAGVSLDNTQNLISGSHKIFTEISSNFNTNEEEITLEAQNDSLTIKNYIEGTRVNDKFMRSQLKLGSAEFEKYQIKQETAVTFCLKEFRAFLQFAESINENMDLHFNDSGSPIFVNIKKYNHVDCMLVMSTLSQEDISFYDDCCQNEVSEESFSIISQLRNRQKRKITNNTEISNSKSQKRIADQSTLSNDTSVFNFVSNSESAGGLQSVNVARNLDSHSSALVGIGAKTPALPIHSVPVGSDVFPTFCDTEEKIAMSDTEDDCVPSSPPNRNGAQLRSIFSRCFQSTYVLKEPSPSSQVYAPNSDTED